VLFRSPGALCTGCVRSVCSGPLLRSGSLRLRVRPEVPSLLAVRTEGQVGLLPSVLREELLRSGLLRSTQVLCTGPGLLCPGLLQISSLRGPRISSERRIVTTISKTACSPVEQAVCFWCISPPVRWVTA